MPAPPGILANVLAETGVAHRYATSASPVGTVFVAWSGRGIRALVPVAKTIDFEGKYHADHGRPVVPSEIPRRLARQLERAFETGRLGSLRVDLEGLTSFQKAVLDKTTQVPPAELRPYGWIAREIGNAGAVRAVGSALNKNPVPILIPCHRVGPSDGAVGRYAYGPEMKRALLRHEGLDPDAVDTAAERGIRFTGTRTTHIFCLPTCRHSRRVSGSHLVEFRSQSDAEQAGYRPCKVCRPAA